MLPYIFISILTLLSLFTFIYFHRKVENILYQIKDFNIRTDMADIPEEEREEIRNTYEKMRKVYEKHEKDQLFAKKENQLLTIDDQGYVSWSWDPNTKKYLVELTEKGNQFIKSIKSTKDLGLVLQTIANMKFFKGIGYSINGRDCVLRSDAEMFRLLIREMATKLTVLAIKDELAKENKPESNEEGEE